jgi:hypothetical protein
MEKSESGPLKSVASIFGVVARIFGTLPGIVIILFMLWMGTFAYQINRQASKGKDWCESVISEYEADREKFLEVHSDRLYDGSLYLSPSPEYKDKGASGNFTVKSNGEYICKYWHGGFSKPHGYEYSSKTREWIKYD